MADILVTGAAGFIGYHVAAALAARGDRVIGIDNINPYYDPQLKRDRLADLGARAGDAFRFVEVDFADDTALETALVSFDFDRIVHLGAQPGVRHSIDNPRSYVRSNLVGHLNLLEVARARRTAHMVYASSSSVYGGNTAMPFRVEDRVDHPRSLYAATKKADELMSETYAHLYRLPLTGLRFFTVYGPWGRPDMAAWLFTDRHPCRATDRCVPITASCAGISLTSTISSRAFSPASTGRRRTTERKRRAGASNRMRSTISAITAPRI